ncbi:MAG: hypothetical protein Q9182_001085 [Xanthomendoza sp. 2 TL-2023]
MALNRSNSEQRKGERRDDVPSTFQSNEEDAFPRVSETETPELEALSSESESDRIPVSLSRRTGKVSKAKLKRSRKQNQQRSSSQHSSIPYLRTAQEIMNRIEHDDSLQISDYLVGYEDRHCGIMWKGVAEWLEIKETEEEDFIPQHRIRYFKRQSDDHVVWDRVKRVDEIFGSGLSGVTGNCDEA